MRIAAKILDFLYPPNAVCMGCGDPSGAERDGLCEGCLQQLEVLRLTQLQGRCPNCLAPLYDGKCSVCELFDGSIRRATFAYRYAAPASGLIRRFKYDSMGYLCEWMAEQMLNAPHAREMLRDADVLAYAPADRVRRARRGYNQAQLLAKAIAARIRIPQEDALRRKAFIRPQARLRRDQRLQNLSGAIDCPKDMTGRRVLLIDDVRTTGATAAACAKALLAAGAAQVQLLTFAASDGHPTKP